MIRAIFDMFLILVALASGIRLAGRFFTAMLTPPEKVDRYFDE